MREFEFNVDFRCIHYKAGYFGHTRFGALPTISYNPPAYTPPTVATKTQTIPAQTQQQQAAAAAAQSAQITASTNAAQLAQQQQEQAAAQAAKPVVTQTVTKKETEVPTTTEIVAQTATEANKPAAIAVAKKIGTSTGTASLEAKRAIQIQKEDSVKLSTGEYVDKAFYNGLSSADQAQLNKLGVQVYNNYKQTVQLSTGEFIGRDDFLKLSTNDQAQLQKLGIAGYNNYVNDRQNKALSQLDTYKITNEDKSISYNITKFVTDSLANKQTIGQIQTTLTNAGFSVVASDYVPGIPAPDSPRYTEYMQALQNEKNTSGLLSGFTISQAGISTPGGIFIPNVNPVGYAEAIAAGKRSDQIIKMSNADYKAEQDYKAQIAKAQAEADAYTKAHPATNPASFGGTRMMALPESSPEQVAGWAMVQSNYARWNQPSTKDIPVDSPRYSYLKGLTSGWNIPGLSGDLSNISVSGMVAGTPSWMTGAAQITDQYKLTADVLRNMTDDEFNQYMLGIQVPEMEARLMYGVGSGGGGGSGTGGGDLQSLTKAAAQAGLSASQLSAAVQAGNAVGATQLGTPVYLNGSLVYYEAPAGKEGGPIISATGKVLGYTGLKSLSPAAQEQAKTTGYGNFSGEQVKAIDEARVGNENLSGSALAAVLVSKAQSATGKQAEDFISAARAIDNATVEKSLATQRETAERDLENKQIDAISKLHPEKSKAEVEKALADYKATPEYQEQIKTQQAKQIAAEFLSSIPLARADDNFILNYGKLIEDAKNFDFSKPEGAKAFYSHISNSVNAATGFANEGNALGFKGQVFQAPIGQYSDIAAPGFAMYMQDYGYAFRSPSTINPFGRLMVLSLKDNGQVMTWNDFNDKYPDLGLGTIVKTSIMPISSMILTYLQEGTLSFEIQKKANKLCEAGLISEADAKSWSSGEKSFNDYQGNEYTFKNGVFQKAKLASGQTLTSDQMLALSAKVPQSTIDATNKVFSMSGLNVMPHSVLQVGIADSNVTISIGGKVVRINEANAQQVVNDAKEALKNDPNDKNAQVIVLVATTGHYGSTGEFNPKGFVAALERDVTMFPSKYVLSDLTAPPKPTTTRTAVETITTQPSSTMPEYNKLVAIAVGNSQFALTQGNANAIFQAAKDALKNDPLNITLLRLVELGNNTIGNGDKQLNRMGYIDLIEKEDKKYPTRFESERETSKGINEVFTPQLNEKGEAVHPELEVGNMRPTANTVPSTEGLIHFNNKGEYYRIVDGKQIPVDIKTALNAKTAQIFKPFTDLGLFFISTPAIGAPPPKSTTLGQNTKPYFNTGLELKNIVIDPSVSDIDKSISSGRPVIIDVSAPGCHWCEEGVKQLEILAVQMPYADIYVVTADSEWTKASDPNLQKYFEGLGGFPSLSYFVNGQEVKTPYGGKTSLTIEEVVSKAENYVPINENGEKPIPSENITGPSENLTTPSPVTTKPQVGTLTFVPPTFFNKDIDNIVKIDPDSRAIGFEYNGHNYHVEKQTTGTGVEFWQMCVGEQCSSSTSMKSLEDAINFIHSGSFVPASNEKEIDFATKYPEMKSINNVAWVLQRLPSVAKTEGKSFTAQLTPEGKALHPELQVGEKAPAIKTQPELMKLYPSEKKPGAITPAPNETPKPVVPGQKLTEPVVRYATLGKEDVVYPTSDNSTFVFRDRWEVAPLVIKNAISKGSLVSDVDKSIAILQKYGIANNEGEIDTFKLTHYLDATKNWGNEKFDVSWLGSIPTGKRNEKSTAKEDILSATQALFGTTENIVPESKPISAKDFVKSTVDYTIYIPVWTNTDGSKEYMIKGYFNDLPDAQKITLTTKGPDVWQTERDAAIGLLKSHDFITDAGEFKFVDALRYATGQTETSVSQQAEANKILATSMGTTLNPANEITERENLKDREAVNSAISYLSEGNKIAEGVKLITNPEYQLFRQSIAEPSKEIPGTHLEQEPSEAESIARKFLSLGSTKSLTLDAPQIHKDYIQAKAVAEKNGNTFMDEDDYKQAIVKSQLSTTEMLAQYIPFQYARSNEHWNQLAGWEKVVYPVLDTICLIPVVGLVAKGAELGLKEMSVAAKIALLGGKEAVATATDAMAKELTNASVKIAARQETFVSCLNKLVSSNLKVEMTEQIQKDTEIAGKDFLMANKEYQDLAKNYENLAKLNVAAGNITGKEMGTATANLIKAVQERFETTPVRAANMVGGLGSSAVVGGITIKNWDELNPAQRVAGITFTLLPLGLGEKVLNAAENILDPYKIPVSVLVPRKEGVSFKPIKGQLYEGGTDTALKLLTDWVANDRGKKISVGNLISKMSDAGASGLGTLRLALDEWIASPEATRITVQDLINQIAVERKGTATSVLGGASQKANEVIAQRPVNIQELVNKGNNLFNDAISNNVISRTDTPEIMDKTLRQKYNAGVFPLETGSDGKILFDVVLELPKTDAEKTEVEEAVNYLKGEQKKLESLAVQEETNPSGKAITVKAPGIQQVTGSTIISGSPMGTIFTKGTGALKDSSGYYTVKSNLEQYLENLKSENDAKFNSEVDKVIGARPQWVNDKIKNEIAPFVEKYGPDKFNELDLAEQIELFEKNNISTRETVGTKIYDIGKYLKGETEEIAGLRGKYETFVPDGVKITPGVTVHGTEGGQYYGPALYPKFSVQSAYGLKGEMPSGILLGIKDIESLPRSIASENIAKMEKATEKILDGVKNKDINQVIQGFKEYQSYIEFEVVVPNESQIQLVENLRSSLGEKLNLKRGNYYTRDNRGNRIELIQMYIEGGRDTPYTLSELYKLKGKALTNALEDIWYGLTERIEELKSGKATVASLTKEQLQKQTAEFIDSQVRQGKMTEAEAKDYKAKIDESIKEESRVNVPRDDLRSAIKEFYTEENRKGVRQRNQAIQQERARDQLRDIAYGELQRADYAAIMRRPELSRTDNRRPSDIPEVVRRTMLERPEEAVPRLSVERVGTPIRTETPRVETPRTTRTTTERVPNERVPITETPRNEITRSTEREPIKTFVEKGTGKLLTPTGNEKFDNLDPNQRIGVVAWKQGWIYKARYFPYNQADIINTRKPIEGVQYYEGLESAKKSAVLERGELPRDVHWTMGIVDMDVAKTPEGKKPVLRYTRSRLANTGKYNVKAKTQSEQTTASLKKQTAKQTAQSSIQTGTQARQTGKAKVQTVKSLIKYKPTEAIVNSTNNVVSSKKYKGNGNGHKNVGKEQVPTLSKVK